ncbi:MAG: 7-carboxy-7-deazaguanine synthase QueE [Pseudomonadales bacterium]|nr:7-carboxy-7-deazaguanine synthase QueE [Pseudomonadales bacterium]
MPEPTGSEQLLKITEVFYSLQGESLSVGLPTTFIRLTGCPLRCGYCDTSYAFRGGKPYSTTQLIEKVGDYNTRHICITGGEPLAQKGVHELICLLCDKGYSVSLETSGAMDVSMVDKRVSIVMDIKTPGSGEVARNLYKNIEHLSDMDQIKFVICDREDYLWAKQQVIDRNLSQQVGAVLFSASVDELEFRNLADWIVEDQLPVRFQMQLHKLIWDDEPGR